jgi:quercetin dioxygenase-like cupin family protein
MSTNPRSPFIVRPGDVAPYTPPNHEGTRNFRLVGADVNGARFMEVVLGEVAAGGGVSMHAHPGIEQAQYFLEGEAEVTIDGQTHQVRAGDLCFFPADTFHSVRVTSERMKVLILYAPPLASSSPSVIVK